MKALGVDIGNVIIDFRSLDASFEVDEANYSSVPAANGVFEALKDLNDTFNGRVYLISKATSWARERIRTWLVDNTFHERTKIGPDHIYFVDERHQKDAICKELGISHFIDDRLEVLSHMIETVPNLYLYKPDPAEVELFKDFKDRVKTINEWSDAKKILAM